ncbi:NB-ARC domain disease resistance protein [Medicago truncatula]|uniref:NB-ARC domain disease resistance protein n=1 Tax=Medicago truncatula TaxID=3880 RepID=A0A072TP14_MEDTR|nr:NB-ARC domain disease resistance protein [Medicago truncatula]
MDVAVYCKKSSFIEVHELQPLTEEKSFDLFNKKAFQFDLEGCCPKELIDISFEIARKCKGLPLAIVEFSENRGNKKNRMRRDIRRKLGLEIFLRETAFWRKREKTREEENQEREAADHSF